MNTTKKIKKGKILIYPTDTLYGLGCNAKNKKSVEKIREIKGRDNKPFSVIAPSINWIRKHCIIDVPLEKYLPGPYTIILKKKKKKFLSWVSNTDSLGIRIPDCPFTEEIEKAKVPFITTSVNISGKPSAKRFSDISKKILNQVDLIVKAKNLSGKPSTLIINGKVIKRT